MLYELLIMDIRKIGQGERHFRKLIMNTGILHFMMIIAKFHK